MTRKRLAPVGDAAAAVGFPPASRDLVLDDANYAGTLPEPPRKNNRGGSRISKLTPEMTRIAKTACSMLGVTNRQLAALLGVYHETIEDWLRDNSDFFAAVRDGKDQFNSRKVEQSLLQRALGFEYDEVTREQTEVLLPGKGLTALPGVKVKVVRKRALPDTTAIIFFLVNRTRRSGRWQNCQNVKVEGSLDKTFTFDFTGMKNEDLVVLRTLLAKMPAALPEKRAEELSPAEPLEGG